MRLIQQRDVNWKSRSHFFGIAAQMIRRILVDHFRAARARKRGPGFAALTVAPKITRFSGSRHFRMGRQILARLTRENILRSPRSR